MSERSKSTDVIILSVHTQGENNRSVCALSPEDGIFYSLLYGGPKSVLRSLVQPFNTGKIWLYENQTKHSIKITDFDVKSCHMSFRTSLYKMWAANMAAELVVKTKCAGENKRAFELLTALTDGMDACDENGARLGMLRFLWRYLGLMGVQPQVTHCSVCGTSLLKDNMEASYTLESRGLLCPECSEKALFKLDSQTLTYLAAINTLAPRKVRELVISSESAWNLKQFLYYLIEHEANCRLETVQSGAGIL